ncbi:Bro-N domain-containing protein [Desulfovibrio desulfuricans]|uniref:BRO-N domain-containing protein n=1 Tax=Desulfovibrio desulfuricans TaxID=876 RepID=UPI003983FC60
MTPVESGLKIFEKPEFGSVRVVEKDGEPWFVAKDVCDCLELGNTTEALRGLDDDEKFTLSNPEGNPRAGIPLELNVISESGLYSLILRSRKPESKTFKRWIVREVIPTIRKTGSYSPPPRSYAEALRALAAEVEVREAVEAQKALAENQRDDAIRTKAEIGNRREATAMATASAATRKVGALENRLGLGKNYKQVKAIPWLLDEFVDCRVMYQQVGKKLSAISQRMGFEIQSIPCPEYPQGVKAYHVDVVNAFQQELRRDLNMLGKWRLRETAA